MRWIFIYVFCILILSCHVIPANNLEAATYNTQLGLAYLAQGDRPRAKHKLVLALSQAPHSATVNTAMGYFMEKSGDIDSAQRYYQIAMRAEPGRGAPLNNYGAFLCRFGKYQEAQTYFMRALRDEKYEQTAKVYENAGLCAMEIPDLIQAEKYFRKALEHDPKLKNSLQELAKIHKRSKK
jgi:type IV pilus assembly protein PilF